MAQIEIPFEYHEEKLGVKVKFLIKDDKVVSAHEESLKLISYNALYRRMKSKTQPERELRRASLGFDALVEYNSLMQEWRDALVLKFGKPAERVKASFFAQHYVSDRKAFDFFCAHRYGDDNNKKLEPEVIELYTYNASVLNAVVEVKQKRKMYAKSLGLTGQFDIWQSLSNDVNAFQQVRHDLPTTKDSLRHKVNRYVKEGYAAIVSGKYGKRNAAKVKNDEQMALIRVLLGKHQNMDNEQVAEHYNEIARITNQPTISAATIANYKKEFGLFVYGGRRGETEFMHNIEMQNKRRLPSAAMMFWSMDGWVAELVYQKTTVNKNGKSVTTYHNRLNIVFVLDPYNDYIIGYAIGESETPTLIRQALKNAVKHTEELFGKKYKPYQLQTDNYQVKNLRDTYTQVVNYFTPAKVKNSKAKPVESFNNRFNKEYFQKGMAINWSGHNVTSRKENQVNSDYLNKVKHLFPDENGCRAQIVAAIEKHRAQRLEKYLESWQELATEFKTEFTTAMFLRAFGDTTGFTNRMRGNGLTPTLLGMERAYDSFDLNFRKYMHEDWMVYYDEDDLSQILVSNAKSRNGKLVEEIGNLEFILEEKYIQPMALADQKEGDAYQRQLVSNYNKELRAMVTDQMVEDHEIVGNFLQGNPRLDTLRKLMLSDSTGQHKDQKSAERLGNVTQKIAAKQAKQEQKVIEADWKEVQDDYLKEKVNLNKYADL